MRALLLLLGFGALALLVGAMTIWWWWAQYGSQFQDDLKTGIAAGIEFGKDADQNACLSEAFERNRRRVAAHTEGEAGLEDNFFLSGCLMGASPSKGFCEDVPSQWNAIATTRWTEQRCAAEGLDNSNCAGMLTAVVQTCQQGVLSGK